MGRATRDERAIKRDMTLRLGWCSPFEIRACPDAPGERNARKVCCAFESCRLCWMCGGASINSYWFRCRLRTLPPPPPRLPFLLSSSVTEC